MYIFFLLCQNKKMYLFEIAQKCSLHVLSFSLAKSNICLINISNIVTQNNTLVHPPIAITECDKLPPLHTRMFSGM